MSAVTKLSNWFDNGTQVFTKNAARSAWFADDQYYTGGNVVATPDWGLGWNTAQTVDGVYFGLSAAQNTLVIGEYADRTFDFAHGAQTNPTVFIHSAAQSTTQWGSFAHDQTNFVITSGAGAISFVPSGVGASSVLLTNSAGARTVAHTVVTFDGTAGAAAGGTLFDINVTQTGAGASPLFDIDIATLYTGEVFSAVIGAVAYASDVINIDLGNTQTAAQIAVLDAGDSARTTDAIQITDNTTSTGDTFAITVAGAAASGAVFDIDVGAVAWAGDILNLDLGATSTTGQIAVLTGGAAARTTHLVQLDDAGTSTGIGFDINKTGASYSNGLGYIDIVRSGNFTGVAGETAMDFRIAPAFTLTEPGAGTFNYYGAAIDMSGVLVTAAAGTTLISALTLTGSADADIGRSRALVLGGTDARNGIQFGTETTSPILYPYAAEIIRMMNSTDARGIVYTLTAAGVQTIGTTAGNLMFSPTSANVATAANVDLDMSAGGRLYGGGVQINPQTLAANTNLTMDENDGHVDITSGAASDNTITLPAASGNQGMVVSFYLEVDGGLNAVITRAGADVIQNGAADLANTTVTLDTAGEYLMLQCVSASMWQVVVNNGGVVA